MIISSGGITFLERSVCVLLLLIATGRNNASPTTTGDSSAVGDNDKSKPVVAFVMKSLANEFFAIMEKGTKTHQAEHADKYKLVSGIKDERDLSQQVAMVEEMAAA